jgi:signal transduction histidine kinase
MQLREARIVEPSALDLRARRSDRREETRARVIRGFGHDVKNPLGSAEGYLALIEQGVIDASSPDGVEAIVRARKSIARAIALINELVSYSEGERAQFGLHLNAHDMREIAGEVAEDYRPLARTRRLALHVRLPQDLPPVRTDAARVRQILGNLLSNAIKYTDRGAVEVTVEETRHEGDGDGRRGVAVHVGDSGCGIPPEQIQLLFLEFSRLGSEREGVGLGLAISRRVASAIGGRLTVESEPGEGSRFSLWLPLS